LQRNRVRAVKQKAHTRQNALLPMRSADCRLGENTELPDW